MKNKRFIIYAIMLILLGITAYRIFHTPDELKELKKVTPVTSGVEKAEKVIHALGQAAEKKSSRMVAKYIFKGRDSVEIEDMVQMLCAEPKIFPVKIQRFVRLEKSHRKDNLIAYVFSENRKGEYAISMLKDHTGEYKVTSIVRAVSKKGKP